MTNIAEIFSRDPATHTESDIDEIIKICLDAREKFIASPGKKKGSTATKAAPKLTAKQQKLSGLDLDLKL